MIRRVNEGPRPVAGLWWLLYGDPGVAPSGRSRPGAIEPIPGWPWPV